jgi:hypothetical protein
MSMYCRNVSRHRQNRYVSFKSSNTVVVLLQGKEYVLRQNQALYRTSTKGNNAAVISRCEGVHMCRMTRNRLLLLVHGSYQGAVEARSVLSRSIGGFVRRRGLFEPQEWTLSDYKDYSYARPNPRQQNPKLLNASGVS